MINSISKVSLDYMKMQLVTLSNDKHLILEVTNDIALSKFGLKEK